MKPTSIRPPWWLIAALVWSVTSFVVIAQQSQPPTPPSPTGQVQPPQPPAPQGQGRGRGLGGGRKDDPINADVDWTKQPPLLARTPEEQLKTFILQPGYRLELVLADPIIQEPTAIAFDGNGRMFVVEDRSYMLDLDMTGQLDPISRISLHVDTDNDGKYDRHTVFVDNLVFPRFVTPFGPGVILTKESNAQEVWKYTDTNGDGVADKKELFDTGYGRLGEYRGAGSVPDVGDGQLDVQHLQRVSCAVDAARCPQGADREQRRRVGCHAGQRRQDLVRKRRARGALGISVPHRLRQLQRSRPVRTGLPHPVGRADSHRRHAGGDGGHPHAGRVAEERHVQRRQ